MPTSAMIAGSRTLMFAIEKAMRSRWNVGRSQTHMMRPHMSCSSPQDSSCEHPDFAMSLCHGRVFCTSLESARCAVSESKEHLRQADRSFLPLVLQLLRSATGPCPAGHLEHLRSRLLDLAQRQIGGQQLQLTSQLRWKQPLGLRWEQRLLTC